MEVNPLLPDDVFHNEHSRNMFDAIDKLRSCGANRDFELPELVIVGDQSAGKSSLLQSLTDIPFPVANNVCTRFPTRIISRRDPGSRETTTTVSIERNIHGSPIMDSPDMDFRFGDILDQRYQELDGFKHSFTTMTKADFAMVINEATDVLGISRGTSAEETSTPPDTTHKRNFSNHELKIVISGPDRSHFSILDVPGIFQSPTGRITTADKDGVDSMVSQYMTSRQSIIICVASGTNDIGVQAIFRMVKKKDPEGERTIGVITKCDVDKEREKTIVEAAKNKVRPLHHGWFVVRNRTSSEVEEGIGPMEHSSREQEFFSGNPWNQLPTERRGTKALKKYLAKLLCDRIEKVFPTILSDLRSRRYRTAAELEALEVPRASVEQKREYLTRIAHDLNQLATQGLRGRYDRIAGHDMKLRMKVRDANDWFASEMNTNGHLLAFSLGPFGLKAQASKVRPHRPAAQPIPFQAHTERDHEGWCVNCFQSISSMGPYRDHSFEELRLSHYSQAQPPPLPEPFTSASGSIIGAPTPQSSTKSFGQNSSPFGSLGIPSSTSQSKTQATGQNSSPFARVKLPISTPQSLTKTTGQNSSGSIFGAPTPQSLTKTTDQDSGGFIFQLPSSTPQSKTKTTGEDSVFHFASESPSPSRGNPSIQKEPDGIYPWIRNEIKSSRGTELQGTMNPDVLPILFHKQACKWRAISESHFKKVSTIAYSATSQALDAVCKDPITRKKIMSLISEVTIRSKDRFLALLSQRVDHILSRHLQTNNPAFEQKVSEARKRRFHAALERYKASRQSKALFSNGTDDDGDRLVIDMRDVDALFAELHMSNSQNLEDEVHDTLKAYYEIARDDFIEYVTQLTVEPYLSDPEGPVLFFSPVYVAGLKDEDIQLLGQEDETNMRKRAEKEETLARLNRAEQIAREYDQG